MNKDEMKMIEEMAKTIVDCGMSDCVFCNGKHKCIYYKSAELLHNADYRKVGEDEIVIKKSEFERFQRIENTLKRISTVSPTEAEVENKALKETIAIILAQKRNIWGRYNEKCKEFEGAKQETAREILQELYDEAISYVCKVVELTTFQIEQRAKEKGIELEKDNGQRRNI